VEGQLKEAKADRRESERERVMLKAVTNMKQLFTGRSPSQNHSCHFHPCLTVSYAFMLGAN
jgi:hypothetical protein